MWSMFKNSLATGSFYTSSMNRIFKQLQKTERFASLTISISKRKTNMVLICKIESFIEVPNQSFSITKKNVFLSSKVSLST